MNDMFDHNTDAFEDPNAAALRHLAKKPDISHLEDGTIEIPEGILPLFSIGEKIVIERYCSILVGKPWLDTKTYIVKDIDDESGYLKLWDPEFEQQAVSNFKVDKSIAVIKLPPKKGTIGAKKRGRPKSTVEKPVKEINDGKSRRGRPAGSKNRPKDVIAKEKKAKEQEKKPRVAKLPKPTKPVKTRKKRKSK